MKRILAGLLMIALFSTGYAEEITSSYPSCYSSVAMLKAAGLNMAQETEEEGIVLLKNVGPVLPLRQGAQVSLFGVTSIDPVYGGTGSGAVETDSAPDYVDSFAQAGLTVANTDLLAWYAEQKAEANIGRDAYSIGEAKWSKVKKHLGANNNQVRGTAAFFILGRVGGEGSDMTKGANKQDAGRDGTDYLFLNDAEAETLVGLKELKEEGVLSSITLIINSANPLSAAFLFDETYGLDAALWVGSLGQTGVYAVGRVVSGAINPSGCLPDTWWMDNMANPVINNFGVQVYKDAETYFPGRSYYEFTRYVVYQEGIYLGYRYTETRFEDAKTLRDGAGSFDYDSTVAFPFGYGLSYTTFDVSDMHVEWTGENWDAQYSVSVVVTNTGSIPGKKTIQIYTKKPYTDYDMENAVEKAAVELVGFDKTTLLLPGESQQLTISVPLYYLTSYDAWNTEAFILDEGVYALICAENAHDAALRIQSANLSVETDVPAPSVSDPLVWSIYRTFDSETFSASYGTGADVVSLFSMADMNRYDGAGSNEINWYSRRDWESTLTEGPVELTMSELMALDLVLSDDDLSDDSGVDFPAMGIDHGMMLCDLKDAAWEDEAWDAFMDQLTFEELELICCTGLRETAAVERIGKPYTVDHNGPTGVTQRYDYLPTGNGYAVVLDDPNASMTGTCYPCNGILAATFNRALVNKVGEMVGEDAIWAGYSGIYGPGLNLHRSAYAGRVFEYFSEDPLLTGLMGTAWASGVQSKGVYVYCKHLVLNEQEENRAGLGTWCTEQALRELYLRAFELPVICANAHCVMSAFNRLGALWCGASTELLTEWLRGEVGLDGFVITDMYNDAYMVGANEITAGNDIPDGELLSRGYSLEAYREGHDSSNAAVVQAMRLSAKRVLYTVLHSRAMD